MEECKWNPDKETDSSKLAATGPGQRTEQTLDTGMQGILGEEAGAGRGGKSTWTSSLDCIVSHLQ